MKSPPSRSAAGSHSSRSIRQGPGRKKIDAIVECKSQRGGARGSELRARLARQGRRLPLLGSDDQTANRQYVRHFLLDDYREFGKQYNLQWAERLYYVDERPPARSKVDEYVEKNSVRI